MTQRPRQQNPGSASGRWFFQVAIIGSAVPHAVLVLLLRERMPAADMADVAGDTEETTTSLPDDQSTGTPTLPEAVGNIHATAELEQTESQPLAVALPDEPPESQLEQLLAAGQTTLGFFHSSNCVQCIKWYYLVAAVCLLIGLAILGAFHLPKVPGVGRVRERIRLRGLPGALALGLVSGLVASQCATPVLPPS